MERHFDHELKELNDDILRMGALAEDVGLSIHPHPTLAETVGEVAEIFLGSVTDLLPKKPPK